MPREKLEKGWKPKQVAGAPMLLGIAAIYWLIGAKQWFSPDRPPYHGRLSWASEIAYAYFGLQGPAYALWAFAALLTFAAILARQVESRS